MIHQAIETQETVVNCPVCSGSIPRDLPDWMCPRCMMEIGRTPDLDSPA